MGMFDDLIPKGGNAFEDLVRGGPKGYAKARQRLEQTDQFRRQNNAKYGVVGKIANASSDFTAQIARNTGAFDELAGGIDYLKQGGENLLRRATGKPIEIPAATAAKAAIDYERQQQAQYAQEHPVGNILAGIGTALTSGRPTGAATLRNPLAAGAAAAVQNAPFALARQQGSVKQRLPRAAAETAMAFGTGATLTAAGNALGRAAQRARANPTPQRQLSQQGVDLTPGQMMGGFAQRAEDALTSIPVTGDAIRSARVRGVESFDRAAINRTLAPIGGQIAPNADVGRDGVQAASQAISDAYRQALTGVQVAPDQQFATEVAQVMNTPNLTAAQRETLGTIAADLNSRFNGPITGETWKLIDSDLGKAYRAADNASAMQPGGTMLRDAIGRLQQAHGDLLARMNPQAAQAVNAADEATANLMRIRQASQYTGTSARGGVFSPADLNRAVQGMDTSAGNRAFATGNALMQDLTDPAMQVLPQKVPDSGTPLRSLFTAGAGGAGLAALGTSPQALGTAAAVGGATAALYSAPVQRLLNAVYRASTPGQARAALAQLAQLAARDPALVPAYEEAARQLGVPLPPSDGRQAMPQSQPAPTTP